MHSKLKKLLQKRNPYIVIKFVDISRLMMQVFLVKAPSFIMRVQVGQKLRQNLNWPSLKFFPIIFILQRKKCTDRYAKKLKRVPWNYRWLPDQYQLIRYNGVKYFLEEHIYDFWTIICNLIILEIIRYMTFFLWWYEMWRDKSYKSRILYICKKLLHNLFHPILRSK